ncbi:Uncharacterised protein [uncultured archaeon]|nr:Uncharacterised protein [uncultured archaeon]
MFKLKIDTKNDSFTDDPRMEVTRILNDAIVKLAQGNDSGILLDSNGNKVGDFTLTKR